MKKALSVIIVILLTIGLIGCRSDPAAGNSNGTNTSLQSNTLPSIEHNFPEGSTATTTTIATTAAPTDASVEEPTDALPTDAPAQRPTDALPTDAPNGTGRNYVLNTNTFKFHYTDCKSVAKISTENRRDFYGTRQEVVDMGYEPCKNCNP